MEIKLKIYTQLRGVYYLTVKNDEYGEILYNIVGIGGTPHAVSDFINLDNFPTHDVQCENLTVLTSTIIDTLFVSERIQTLDTIFQSLKKGRK